MYKFIVLVASSVIAATAMAGDDKAKSTTKDMSTTATFDSLDKNADQQISKTEASVDKKLSDSFAAADSNGDGYISKSEFAARTKT